MKNISYDAELRIPSDLIYLRSVRAFIRELAESMGFCQERVNNIELATDEIFTNAIQHGSVSPTSKILLHCSLTDEMMRVVISDAGQGKAFDEKWLSAWSNVTRKEAFFGTEERGHGLFLAHSLADEMSMESNSVGGVDVHLVWYTERGGKYHKISFGRAYEDKRNS